MFIVAGGVLALPGSGDISRPQSSSSRSSCEYQQSPVAAPEFVSPDYRADRRPSSGYFRSYNVQQAGGYYSPHYQGYNNTNGPTSAPGPAYRQNIQAGADQGYSGYSTGYPGYPGYEGGGGGGGQEMSGYYQHQPQPQPQPHTTNNANYSKQQSYGHHYPGYYPGAGCQGVDNNTPLPPDFTYVGSSGGGGQ